MKRVKILQTLLLIAATISSCSKVEPQIEVESNSDQIAFGLSSDWTRGEEIISTSQIESQQVFSYKTKSGKSWAQNPTSADIAPFFTDDIATPFTLTRVDDAGKVWSYDGVKYWPVDERNLLSFVTIFPSEEITSSLNDEGLPQFSYELSPIATENEDVVADVRHDLTKSKVTNSCVEFDLKHVLSKITIQAKTKNSFAEDDIYKVNSPGSEITYKIYGVTFTGLYNNAELVMDGDQAMSWSVDETLPAIDVTATQGYTLKGAEDYELSETYTSVMSTGKAIFLLPQTVKNHINGDEDAKVKVRLLRSIKDKDGKVTNMLYETAAMPIPLTAATSTALDMGTHYKYSLEFDLSELSDYNTPMTVISEVYPWTETDLDITIHKNIYSYISNPNIVVATYESTAELTLCTNYIYDLRVPYQREELDGKLTTTRGFLFYSNEFHKNGIEVCYEPVIIGNNGLEYEMDENIDLAQFEDASKTTKFRVKVGEQTGTANLKNGIAANFSFDFTVCRSTRDKEGLYVSPTFNEHDAYGVNKEGDDAVYILTFDLIQDHIKNATDGVFNCALGAEMISNGGGKITFKYPVTVEQE